MGALSPEDEGAVLCCDYRRHHEQVLAVLWEAMHGVLRSEAVALEVEQRWQVV